MIADPNAHREELDEYGNCICIECQTWHDFLVWIHSFGRRVVIESFIDYCRGTGLPFDDGQEDEIRSILRSFIDKDDLEEDLLED